MPPYPKTTSPKARVSFPAGIVVLWMCAIIGIIMPAALPGQTTVYWDTNGTASGTGTTPNGTWVDNNSGPNRNWSTAADGTASTARWNNGSIANFSAGADATGSYTVTISGTVQADGIVVDDGSPTLASGTLSLAGAANLQIASGSTLTISSTISGSLNKTGAGTLVLGGSNYADPAVVETGTLQAGADINFNGGLELGAGTTLALGGNNVTVGTLAITGNSVIDFGGSSTLSVGTLSISSGATLTITGWAFGVDFFYADLFTGGTQGVENGGPAVQIVFADFTGTKTLWGLDNQITAVPEPATYGALFMSLAAGGHLLRRRRS